MMCGRRFAGCRTGIAAVEFALVAPLLLIVLGIAIEAGRLMMCQRQFEQATINIARHIVRFPEYEKRARDGAPKIAAAVFPAGNVANFNLTVNSLLKSGGALTEVFPPHTPIGHDPGIKWKDYLQNSEFVEGQSVVFIDATYTYKSLFLDSFLTFTFKKTVTTLPNFSRNFPWNDANSPDKYVY